MCFWKWVVEDFDPYGYDGDSKIAPVEKYLDRYREKCYNKINKNTRRITHEKRSRADSACL